MEGNSASGSERSAAAKGEFENGARYTISGGSFELRKTSRVRRKAHRPMFTTSRWVWFLVVAVAPYSIVIAFGYRSWEGRLISVGYFWALVSVLPMLFAFLPSKQLITPEAKLRQVSHKVTGTVILCFRAGAVALAIVAGFYSAVYCHDVYDLVRSRHVKTITGRVTSIQYGARTWWCYENVWVQTNGSLQAYSLLFYPASLQQGSDYVMQVLPRSKTILAFERSSPSR